MANVSFTRNLLSFLVQKRCLNTSPKIPPLPSSLPEITKDSNFALHFLTYTCGLSLKSAISVSQKLQFQEKNEKKLQSVIDYLKDEGFTQTDVAVFIQKFPRVLHSNVETTLKPKLEFFKHNGFVGELLIELLVKKPSLLQKSLDSQVKPALELLRFYLKSDEKMVFAIRRCLWLFEFSFKNIMQPNIEFLVKEGVPSTSIAKIITLKPTAVAKEHSRTIYAVNSLKKMGLEPTSPMFVYAFCLVVCLNESTWKKKMEFLQSFGWTENDVLTAFKRFPNMMGYSEERIRKSMNFFQKTMKLDLQTIITHPTIFVDGIDTRVSPRYIVLKILKSKKLIKEDRKILHLFKLSDQAFLAKYVIKYEEAVPGLLEIYSASKNSKACSLSDLQQLAGVDFDLKPID